jgi:hypothetical protein
LTGADLRGNALIADGCSVGGDVFLRSGFTARGAVRLPGARITGQLTCSDADLAGMDNDLYSLVADNIRVGEHVLLNGNFRAVGAVRLSGARVDGTVMVEPSRLAGDQALSAIGMRVGQVLT